MGDNDADVQSTNTNLVHLGRVCFTSRFETSHIAGDNGYYTFNTRGRIVLSKSGYWLYVHELYLHRSAYRRAVCDESLVHFRIVCQNVDNTNTHSFREGEIRLLLM